MSTVPDVGVCCKVTIMRPDNTTLSRVVEDGDLIDVLDDALWLSGLRNADPDGFSITVKRERHDA